MPTADDLRETAKIVSQIPDDEIRKTVALDFAGYYGRVHRSFSWEKFLRACNVSLD